MRVQYENAKRQIRQTGEEDVRLTNKMRLSRAYYWYLQISRQLDLDAGVEPKKRIRSKKSTPKSRHKDDKTVVVSTAKLIPKITGESTISEEQIQGRRVPTARKQPSTLIESDVNQTINFGGILEDVIVESNHIWLVISSADVKKRVIINEAALNLAPVNFTELMATLKSRLKSLGKNPIFSCVIETIPSSKEGSIQCMIRDVSDILINGKAVSVYLAKLNQNK